MVYLILGEEKIDAFKQELIENKYGIFRTLTQSGTLLSLKTTRLGYQTKKMGVWK